MSRALDSIEKPGPKESIPLDRDAYAASFVENAASTPTVLAQLPLFWSANDASASAQAYGSSISIPGEQACRVDRQRPTELANARLTAVAAARAQEERLAMEYIVAQIGGSIASSLMVGATANGGSRQVTATTWLAKDSGLARAAAKEGASALALIEKHGLSIAHSVETFADGMDRHGRRVHALFQTFTLRDKVGPLTQIVAEGTSAQQASLTKAAVAAALVEQASYGPARYLNFSMHTWLRRPGQPVRRYFDAFDDLESRFVSDLETHQPLPSPTWPILWKGGKVDVRLEDSIRRSGREADEALEALKTLGYSVSLQHDRSLWSLLDANREIVASVRFSSNFIANPRGRLAALLFESGLIPLSESNREYYAKPPRPR